MIEFVSVYGMQQELPDFAECTIFMALHDDTGYVID